MDRKLYKFPFRKDNPPPWICPSCGNGILKIKKDSFFAFETANSRKGRSHEGWAPMDQEYVYSCLLECSNDSCKDMVANSGEGFIDVEFDGDVLDYSKYCRPKYFYPHLMLFPIPNDVPENVAKELKQSFELFFCNPPSASNHVRIALEHLLTYLNVKRHLSRSGERKPLSLHKRIDLIPAKYQSLKESFLAIKWLGNAGSHSSKEITLDDVMDAYEIMADVLKKIFEKDIDVKKLVGKIIKRKGPRGKV